MKKVLIFACLTKFIVTQFKLGTRGRDVMKAVVITDKNIFIMPYSLDNNGKEID